MADSQKFPFLQNIGERFLLDPMPYLSLTLEREGQRKQVFGLLDTGSTVCVLPYRVGLDLGAVWEEQTIPLKLKGNLANFRGAGFVADGAHRRICSRKFGVRLDECRRCAAGFGTDKFL